MKCFLSLLIVLAAAISASAQSAVLEGRLVNSLNGDPLGGATVLIDELKREAVSGPDGAFRFENIPPGAYHLWVRATGYSSRRTEVAVPAAGGAPIELRIDFDLHFQEVASVSAEARSQFDTYQPTSVLSGQELDKQLEMSIGGVLESQPGIANRTFGPATARPVIRGLDGDRVLIMQDGQRTWRFVQSVCRPRGDH